MERPYIKFYTRDWQADSALRQCSALARGVWIELICIMAQNDVSTRGYLCLNGRLTEPLNPSVIQRLTGLLKDEIEKGICELIANGVCSKTESGVIYSRRIVKETARSQTNSENGAKGGNPALTGGITEPDKQNSNPHGNINPIVTPNINPNTKSDTGKDNMAPAVKPPTHTRFEKPSVEQIREYCNERKNGVDPQRFFDFYQANGWKQGKGKPIVDWKAAVRTWEQNNPVKSTKIDMSDRVKITND